MSWEIKNNVNTSQCFKILIIIVESRNTETQNSSLRIIYSGFHFTHYMWIILLKKGTNDLIRKIEKDTYLCKEGDKERRGKGTK